MLLFDLLDIHAQHHSGGVEEAEIGSPDLGLTQVHAEKQDVGIISFALPALYRIGYLLQIEHFVGISGPIAQGIVAPTGTPQRPAR